MTLISRTPPAMSCSASRTMSSAVRLRCFPRNCGMVQKEHVRLQPSAIFRYALVRESVTTRGSLARITQSAGLPTSMRAASPSRTFPSLSMSLEPRK